MFKCLQLSFKVNKSRKIALNKSEPEDFMFCRFQSTSAAGSKSFISLSSDSVIILSLTVSRGPTCYVTRLHTGGGADSVNGLCVLRLSA